MATKPVHPLAFSTKLVLALLLVVTIGASSARPHPPSVSLEEALKAATSPTLATKASKAFRVLMRKRIPPSGPSNRGHSDPRSTRHLLHLRSGRDRV
ncbi:hypothetical protein MUK42_14805 [Musa troglodytarum]|uniref:Uncharacterized protein n=1 Tax=Musa troglodytarum TaxID=320322 RepID=A0A9E7L8X3_9LILI|nr:hypothetical protein MUK42_14805 [Musa troglodytarum]